MDPKLEEAIKITCQFDKASASLLQRKLDIGYARAARLLDILEQMGIVGAAEGSMPRDVLIRSFEEYEENKEELLSKIKEEPDYEFHIPAYYPARFDAKDLNFTPKLYTLPLGEKEFTLEQLGQILITGLPQSLKMDLVDLIIFSQLIAGSPSEIRAILFDTSGRLKIFDGLPQLFTPVIDDFDKLNSALKWTLSEMQRRRNLLNDYKTRNFLGLFPRILIVLRFNSKMKKDDIEALRIITSEGTSLGVHTILVEDLDNTLYVPKVIRSNFLYSLEFKGGNPETKELDLNEFLLNKAGEETTEKLKTISLPENWQKIMMTMTVPPENAQTTDPLAGVSPEEKTLIYHYANIIEKTLESFNITAKIAQLTNSEAGVEYKLEIAVGTKVEDIFKRERDIALAVASPTGHVKIEAPIPGRSLVGITVPKYPKQAEDLNKPKYWIGASLLLSADFLKKIALKIICS